MADTGQKTITIDDLVNELSKKDPTPSGVTSPQASPRPQPNQAPIAPSFQRPPSPPVAASQPPVVPPRPISNQPAPTPAPSQVQSQTQNQIQGVKEYQSSIRTMSTDMGNIKSGQQISGVQMPRTVENRPVNQPQAAPKPMSQPAQTQNRGPVTITMGEMQKASTLETQKSAQPTQAPPQPQSPSSIVVPAAKSRKNSTVFIIGGLVILIVLVAYWFVFMRNQDEPIVQPTANPSPSPTVSQSPTPTPEVKLDNIFAGSLKNISLATSGDPVAQFSKDLKAEKLAGGLIERLNLSLKIGSESQNFTPGAALGKFLIAYPASLKSILESEDSSMVVYSQEEQFDKTGKVIVDATPVNRLAVIGEVKNVETAKADLGLWEATMPVDLNALFELNYKKGAQFSFQNNLYKGLTIRYANFPYPDKSIDYVIVNASNQKKYLVITNSRESMYALIDKLMGR